MRASLFFMTVFYMCVFVLCVCVCFLIKRQMEAHRKQSPKCVCQHSVNHHVAYNTVIPRHPPLLCAHHSQPPSSLSASLSASCFVCTVSGTGEERVGHENKEAQGWQQVSFASAGAPIRRTQAHAHGTAGGAATWRHAAECSRGNSSRGFGAGVRMMRAVRGRVQIPCALAPLRPGSFSTGIAAHHQTPTTPEGNPPPH